MLKEDIPEEILSGDNIIRIIKEINNSRERWKYDLESKKLSCDNGKYIMRWNYLFDNIEKAFSIFPFECYKINRGNLWKLVAIYDKNKKFLYILLKEDRFKNIKGSKNDKCHYAKLLDWKNSFNFKNKVQQLSFISNMNSYDVGSNDIDKELRKMIAPIKDEMKACINILFTEDDYGVKSISGNIADYNLKIMKSYNWNKYITANIGEISDTSNDNEDNVESNKVIPLKLRNNKMDKNKEELVDEKKKENIDKDTHNEN